MARDGFRDGERWSSCSLCEQEYHGVVACALGWACWKTFVGRPETDELRGYAIGVLGSGLHAAELYEDALTVREVDVAMRRRLGGSEEDTLIAQGNLAITYDPLGRFDEGLRLQRDVYSGWLKLNGEEHGETLREANNYANSLIQLRRYKEARPVLRKMMPVARRVLGESDGITLKMRWNYADALCQDPGATLDDLREAVMTLEDTARIARRVLGGTHPHTAGIEDALRDARTVLRAREAEATEAAAQNAFRTARVKLAQERSELA